MDSPELVNFLLNIVLFYCAYKIGRFSVYSKIARSSIEKTKLPLMTSAEKRVISVEQIDGIYYAYDGNDFLAQGHDAVELGRKVAARFPHKYRLAQIVVKS